MFRLQRDREKKDIFRGIKTTRGVFIHNRQFLKGLFYGVLWLSPHIKMDLQRLFIDSLLLTFHKPPHSAVWWPSIVG